MSIHHFCCCRRTRDAKPFGRRSHVFFLMSTIVEAYWVISNDATASIVPMHVSKRSCSSADLRATKKMNKTSTPAHQQQQQQQLAVAWWQSWGTDCSMFDTCLAHSTASVQDFLKQMNNQCFAVCFMARLQTRFRRLLVAFVDVSFRKASCQAICGHLTSTGYFNEFFAHSIKGNRATSMSSAPLKRMFLVALR